jgi:uncharacterized repeat protein (TIGR01451 family)
MSFVSKRITAIVFATALFAAAPARAAHFTSTGSGNWNDGSTWNQSGAIPTATDTVEILDGHNVTVVNLGDVAQSVSFGTLAVGASLNISTGGKLTLGGDLNVDADALGSATVDANDGTIIVGGNINIAEGSTGGTATLRIGSGSVTGGDLSFVWTLSASNSRIEFDGPGLLTLRGNMDSDGTLVNYSPGAGSTIKFNGTTSQTIGNFSYHNLQTANANGVITAGAIAVDGTLDVQSGYFLVRHTFNTAAPAALQMAAGTFLKLGDSITTFNVALPNFSSYTLAAGSTIYYGANANQSINSNIPYQHLEVAYTGSVGSPTKQMTGNTTIAGDLKVDQQTPGTVTLDLGAGIIDVNGSVLGDGAISFPSGGELRIAGDFQNHTGTFSGGTGTVVYDGAGGSQAGRGVAYNNLIVRNSGTSVLMNAAGTAASLSVGFGTYLDLSTAFTVSGPITINGTINGTGDVLTLSHSLANPIYGSGEVYANVSLGQRDFDATANLTFGGNVTIQSGIAVTNNGVVTIQNSLDGADGTASFINGTGATLSVAGNLMTTGTLNAAATGNTVTYNGLNQTVFNATYHHLVLTAASPGAKTMPIFPLTVNGDFTIDGSANVTASAAIGVGDDFTLGSTATFAAGSATHTVGGDWSKSGTASFTPGTSIVQFNGTGTQTLTASNFHTIWFDSTGAKYVTGDLDLTGDFVIIGTSPVAQSAASINLDGSWNDPNNTFNPGSGMVKMDGSVASAINTGTFNDLKIDKGSGSVTLGGTVAVAGNFHLASGTFALGSDNIDIAGDFTVDSGSTFSFSSAQASVSGDLITNGTLTPGSGTLRVDGPLAVQNWTGSAPPSVHNLTLDKASGSLNPTLDVTVLGFLTLDNGPLVTTAAVKVTSGQVLRTNGYVDGRLDVTHTTTGAKLYPMGTAYGYSPVTATISAPGQLDVQIFGASHPQNTSAGANVLQTYWSVPTSTVGNVDLAFGWPAGAVNGLESSYVLARHNGSSWSLPSSTLDDVNHTASITGVAALGDWTTGFASSFVTSYDLVITTDGNATAGVPETITITAKDGLNATVTSVNGDHTLVFSGASASPNGDVAVVLDKTSAPIDFGSNTVLTFTNGVATTTATFYAAELVSMQADEPSASITGTQSGISVAIASATALKIADVNNGNPIYANFPFTMNVQVYDPYGNPSIVALGTQIDLTWTCAGCTGTTLGGTISSTIVSNDSGTTFEDLTWPSADTNLVLTATATAGDSLGSDSTGPETINAQIPGVAVTTAADNGAGSLRDAIARVNSGECGTPCNITFDILPAGPHVFQLATRLVSINYPVVIDGESQDGYSGTPLLTIDGDLFTGTAGLDLNGGNSTIRGFILNNINGTALFLGGDANIVQNCWIGTDVTGSIAAGNGTGIYVNGNSNTIGGNVASSRNVISGNTGAGILFAGHSSGNTVRGNYIGTNAAGNAAIANAIGIAMTDGANTNTIGGATVADRNVISGNTTGIQFQGTGTVGSIVGNDTPPVAQILDIVQSNSVENNYIGVAANGTTALANTTGIELPAHAINNNIGGPGTGNVISGNGTAVLLGDTSVTGNVVRGNRIGVGGDGVTAVPNSTAVMINGGAKNNTIGGLTAAEGNVIANNGGAGVFVMGGGIGNVILGNLISNFGSQPIDLDANGADTQDAGDADAGSNNKQNFPALSAATLSGANVTATFSLNSNSTTAQSMRIELFEADANGAPVSSLGSSCEAGKLFTNATLTLPAGTIVAGDKLVATATAYGDAGCAGTLQGDGTSEVSASITVACPAIPVTITGPTQMCAGSSVTLTAPAGYTYLWSTTETSQSIVVSPGGTTAYSVTVMDANGCTGTDSHTVTVDPLPIAAISGPASACGSATLTASGGTSYLWSHGPTTASITVTTGGTYTVTVTGAGGCTATTSHVISIDPTPTPVITAGGPTTFCSGGSVTLTASGGTSYQWSTGETTSSITVTTGGSYTVTAFNGSCQATSAPTVVNVNTVAPFNISGPPSACDSATLTAPAGFTYLWSTSETTQSINVTTGGTYSVTITDANGCTASDTHVISIDPTPTPVITAGGPTTFCSGGSVTLTASGGTSYQWSTGETTPSITVTTGGSYTVTAFNGSCQATSAPTVVNVNTVAPFNISGPASVCDSATLTAPAGFTYLWSTSETTQSINVNTNGTYSVTITDANGCTASDTHVIAVNPSPSISITGPATACDSATLSAPAGFTYLWSTSETTSSISVTTSGTYSVTVTDGNGCTDTASHTVAITTTPAANITASGPTTFCDGASVTLTASAATSYLWSSGETTASIVVTEPGSYTVQTFNGSCSATSAPTVVTVDTPVPVAIAGPSSACDSAVLDAGPNFVSYLWSTQETTPTINVTTSGTYSVTVTDANGCTSTDSHAISINNTLQPAITGPSAACAPQTVTLDAGAGFTSYLWSTNETTRTIEVSATGTYSVTVTGAGGCSGSDSHDVTIATAATPTITASGPTTFCTGESVTLTASNGASYLWSTGANTASIHVTASGNYSVTVTDANGCVATSAVTAVVVNPPPVVNITIAGGVCPSDPLTFDAGAGFVSYHWSTGATTRTISTGNPGTYTVTVTDANGCTASDSAVHPGATPGVPPHLNTPNSVCAGGTAMAQAQPGGVGTWTVTNGTILSGQGTSTITYQAGTSGSVGLTFNHTGACPYSVFGSVSIKQPPVASISVPSTATANSTLSASVPFQADATYVWTVTNGTILLDQGTSAITFKAGASGVTTVAVEVFNGVCTRSDSKNVSIAGTPAPEADLRIVKNGPSAVDAGAQLVWTLTVSNAGPNNAGDVSVVDTLPAGVVVTGINDGPWSCTNANGRVVCDGSLANGASNVITITATAPQQGGAIVNTARVQSNANDPLSGNDTSSVNTMVNAVESNCTTIPASLIAPAQNASVTSPVTFSWSAVAGASEYEVWIVTGDATLLAGTTGTTSLTKALSSGTSNWYVVARFTGACTPLVSAQRTFTVTDSGNCATHGAPQLTAPAAGSTVSSNITFSWTAVPQAIGYRVWIEANGTAAQDLGTTNGAITLEANLPSGPLVAYVDALFSGCPPTRSASIAFNVPAPNPCDGRSVPAALAPANNATLNSSIVDFSWSAATNVSEYRLWAQINGAVPVVLATTAETSHTATIPTGVVSWWVEALYDGCASLESQHFTFTIPQRGECSTQKPELIAPTNNTTLSNGSVTFSWSAVQNATGYEVWLSTSRGTPTLIGTTSATSLTHVVTAGVYDWFVRALVDRCPSRDSNTARFIHTPTDACAATQRPLAISPLSGGKVTSPLSFSWTPVPNATGYDVFTVRGNQAPQLLGSSSTTQLNDVAVSNGRLRWFVRAKFGQSCAPRDSAEQRLEVIAEPAACETLPVPEIVAAGQISSGVPFLIQWTEIAGATSYQLQLSSAANFSGAELISTSDTQHALTRINNGKDPVAVYARVRAIDSRCQPDPNITPYGPRSAIFILPIQGTDAAVPASGGNVTFVLPLGPELAGQSFSAQTKEPWITVAPATGIVPEGGTTLVVTASTTALPLGTSLSAIRITLTSPESGRVRTNATTVVIPANVGASKSTPVFPEARSTPPPDALIIPGVAHADGMNSKFQSDVRVSNTSARVIQYQVTFTPSGDTGLANGKQTTFSIDPGQTIALDDVLRTWFGTGGTDGAMGTLEIRPISEAASLIPASTFGSLLNLSTFASSRTFNVTTNGTFGQYVPAIPFASFVGRTDELQRPTSLSLQQIAQSDQYRTNLGLVEASGEPASLMVKVFGATGQMLTEFPVNLAGGQHAQLNSFLVSQGITSLDDGRVEISVVSPGGKITAYASVLDNATNDPLLVTPVTLTETGANKWVMPGVADLTGNAQWQTDMRVFNAGTEDVESTFRFYSQNGGEPKVATITIPAGQVRQFDKTLSTIFGVTNDGGAVHISTPAAARLVATARTYNQTGSGTYGQFVSAVTPEEAAGLDSRALQILQIEESSRFRSNVGFVEVTGNPVTVELSIVPPDSKFTYVTEVPLAANEYRQLGSVLRSVGLSDTFNARITVRVVQGTGRVSAFASVIDQLTNDPTYVPAQ